MTSPLQFIANSSIYVSGVSSSSSINGGRYEADASGSGYVIECYCTRVQAARSALTTGQNGPNVKLGGMETSRYLYRGYLLGYASVAGGYQHNITNDEALMYQGILGFQELTQVLYESKKVSFRLGSQVIGDSIIEIVGGIYGSQGIDSIVYNELQGIPITLRASTQHG